MRKLFSSDHSVSISPSSIVFGVLFILGLVFLYYVQEIVFTVFLAFILMSALNPGVTWLEKKLKFPRVVGILTLYLLLIAVIAFAFSLIIPPLFAEVPNLINSLHLPSLPEHIRNFHFTMSEINDFLSQMYNSFGTIYAILTSTFNGILGFLTILVMAAYMLIDEANLHKKVVWFSRENRHLLLAREFLESLEIQLGSWVRGQLLLMITIGILVYIGLSLLSVPYALPLAVASSLLEILPNLGPAIAAVPGIVIAYTAMGPAMAGFTLLFYLLIHQLENQIIVPKIMKENADVSPLVTIIVILIGFKMGNMLGALLAVPLYIVLRTVYSFWIRENQ